MPIKNPNEGMADHEIKREQEEEMSWWLAIGGILILALIVCALAGGFKRFLEVVLG